MDDAKGDEGLQVVLALGVRGRLRILLVLRLVIPLKRREVILNAHSGSASRATGSPHHSTLSIILRVILVPLRLPLLFIWTIAS